MDEVGENEVGGDEVGGDDDGEDDDTDASEIRTTEDDDWGFGSPDLEERS